MSTSSKWSSACMAVALLCGLALPGAAQQPVTFDASGGVGVPVADFADMADPGPVFSVAIGYGVHERVDVRIEGGGALYSPTDYPTGQPGPQMDFFRYGLEGLVHVLGPDQPFTLDVSVGGGGSVLVTSETPVSSGGLVQVIDLSSHYPAVSGGLRVGYDVNEQVNFFLQGTSHWTFADEEDLEPFAFLDPALEGASTIWDVPVEAGASFTF